MDTASSVWLNPIMRSSLLAVCTWMALQSVLFGQGTPPSMVAGPLGQQVLAGDAVTLSVVIDGTAPILYQWRKDGTLLPTGTASTYTLNPVALTDAGFYDLVASNAFGSVTTPAAYLGVTKRPQTIAFNPPSAVVAAGSGVVLGATASSGLPVTYVLASGNAALAGNVLTSSGGNVVVRASQPGNATYAAADPVERTIAFVAGALSPFLTSPPTDQSVVAGSTATLRGGAIGTPAPAYQWQKDGVAIPGATSPVLTIPATTLADSGRYTLAATNIVGTATASATLTVRAPPVFTTQPESTTVLAGSASTLTVAATGYPTPSFQWRKNGTALAGATNATLSIAAIAASDAGRYDVVATNALGTVTSSAATLTVVVRDFTGTYFGRFAATSGSATGAGEFALQVRPNRTAVLLGYDATLPAGLALLNLTLDLNGIFSGPLTVGGRSVTVRGSVNEATGEVTGDIAVLNRSFSGARATASGTAAATAGFYELAVVGSAIDRGYLLVGPDGRALLLSAGATAAEGVTASIGANGRLTFTTPSQATVDLGFANGEVSGTVRAGGVVATLGGAIETLIGGERLVNLSVRSSTSNANPLITGFVVSGSAPKQVLIRAAGPTLGTAPFNVAGTLGDPVLQVFRGSNLIAQNDEWGTPAANGAAVSAAITRTGAFPFRAGSNDAALVTTLQPGPYTVAIGGGNGVTLAEVYELLATTETAGARRLVNISARGTVSPGNPLIAGFVIAGSAPQRVLIRGIGPTLGQPPFNVAGALNNPQLSLYRGTTVLKTNDDWFRDPDAALIRDAAARAAAFGLNAQSPDSAMVLYLSPGAYTAQVSSPPNANQQNGTGIALVEVYESNP